MRAPSPWRGTAHANPAPAKHRRTRSCAIALQYEEGLSKGYFHAVRDGEVRVGESGGLRESTGMICCGSGVLSGS